MIICILSYSKNDKHLKIEYTTVKGDTQSISECSNLL